MQKERSIDKEREGEKCVEQGKKGIDLALRRLLFYALFSLGYWLFVCFAITRWARLKPSTAFWTSVMLYLAGTVWYLLALRKRDACRRFTLNKRWVALLLLVVFPTSGYAVMSAERFYLQPYINTVAYVSHALSEIFYDEQSGVFSILAAGKTFKILHLTDVHLGGSLYSRRKDLLALKACYAEIAYAHPDLVIVTGDLCYPLGISSLSFNNSAPIQAFAAFMRNVGIPWAFTYGNHDTEALASNKAGEIDALFKSLSFKTSGNLLYPYVVPSVTGRCNQLIEVKNADGSLNTALFLLDSGAYRGKGLHSYDYIHDDQVDWYAAEVRRLEAREGKKVASLVFFHIPLIEYRTAFNLYKAGSDQVTYHFGENREDGVGKVCCSDHPSKLFDTMVALGSTTGTFCGHDHYNNASLTYRGIRLTYGMSIDYLVMRGIERDTAQRGAELITLNADSSWTVEQIPLTSVT